MSEGLPQLDNAAIAIPSARRNFHEPVKIDPLELVTALSLRVRYANNKSLILALRESTGRMPIVLMGDTRAVLSPSPVLNSFTCSSADTDFALLSTELALGQKRYGRSLVLSNRW